METKILYLRVPNIEQFEQNLRDEETKLGVPFGQGVPVEYDRHSLINPFLILVTLLLFMFARGKIAPKMKIDMVSIV